MSYKYLVIAALQEELDYFIKHIQGSFERLGPDVEKYSLSEENNDLEILAFTPNKMGMPYTSAKVMQVINKYNPRFIFMIGTCAGITKYKKHALGDVLIPCRVFSFESGKLQDGKFLPDYRNYELSNLLLKYATALAGQLHDKVGYGIFTDEDLCSGAAVINDSIKVEEIEKHGSVKLSGLDMEGYAIGCLNDILRGSNDLLVVKSISDYAVKKGESEGSGNKILAMENSADFTFQLIRYIEKKLFGTFNNIINDLIFSFNASWQETATYQLKIKIDIFNNSRKKYQITSLDFLPVGKVKKFGKPPAKHHIPNFYLQKDSNGKDLYETTYTIEPYQSTLGCWVPIEPNIKHSELEMLINEAKVGEWLIEIEDLDSGYRTKKKIPIKTG